MIDLRSDTVTRPSAAMRAAMAAAEVGDDVFGDDPTVNALEARAAQLTGKEAALFVASGTQGNLCALLTHCGRGDEYLCGHDAHTFVHEAGGAAVLGGVAPCPLPFEADSTIALERLAEAVKPDDVHYPRTRLLCLENTHHGQVVPLDYLDQARRFTLERGLALHLDGARVFNAAVALGVAPERITRSCDSVSFCLSKGLGAPVGSVLCGTAPFVAQARRHRKLLGGGMRQAGVLAAAGLVALDQHVERLAEDHANAARLAQGLAALPGCEIASAHTNMVFVRLPACDPALFAARLAERGVRVLAGNPLRLVTHVDVSADDVERVIEAAEAALASA
ncbi:MAG: low-specificity L-threonine aldolase [Acidimicrobiales bacterium]